MLQKLIILILFFTTSRAVDTFAQATENKVNWLFILDGYNTTDLADMDVDSEGNTFVASNYQAYLKIPELNKKLPNARHVAGAIVKLNKQGKPLWAHAIISTFDARIKDVFVAKNGDLLVTGFSDGEVIFPSPGDTLKLGYPKIKNDYHNPQVIFIARYSTAGKRIWAKVYRVGWGEGWSIAENSKQEIYWSFYHRGTMRDGDKIVDSLPGKLNDWTRESITKLNSKGEIIENVFFQNRREGSGSSYAASIKFDHEDALIVYGVFVKSILFSETDSLSNDAYYESSDAYVAKYNSEHKFLWCRKIGGQFYQTIGDLIIDPKNRIYITGMYSYECVISSGVGLLQKSTYEYKSGSSFYYCRFLKDGALDFATYHRQRGYNATCSGSSIAQDKNGYVYLSGSYTDTLDFDGKAKPIRGTFHSSNPFFSRWRNDTIQALEIPIKEDNGWAFVGKSSIKGLNGVFGGTYYGKNYMPDVNGKKVSFSERDYGRSTFVYGASFPDLPKFENEESDSTDHILALKTLTACLSPELQADPEIWIPLKLIIRPTTGESEREDTDCGVRLDDIEAFLAPNPSQDFTTLTLKGMVGKIQIEIYAESGEFLFSQQLDTNIPDPKIDLDFSKAKPAVYFVSVNNSGYKKVLRFVKMR